MGRPRYLMGRESDRVRASDRTDTLVAPDRHIAGTMTGDDLTTIDYPIQLPKGKLPAMLFFRFESDLLAV